MSSITCSKEAGSQGQGIAAEQGDVGGHYDGPTRGDGSVPMAAVPSFVRGPVSSRAR